MDHWSADAVRIMTRPLEWIGLGAALMYYLDPERGRPRRAPARDRINHLLNEIDHEIEVTSYDAVNRTHGLVARTRSFFDDEHAPEAVIVAGVRSKPGHVVSHPRAIRVGAIEGHVTLSGPVLAAERDRVLNAVRSVRGVAGVEDRLQVYERPGVHPALRGGRIRTGGRAELSQETWSPAMRLLAVTTIGVATLRLAGARRASSLALGVLGAGLIARGLSDGNPRRGRASDHPRSRVATGAPVHDVAIPFSRSRGEESDTSDQGQGVRWGGTVRKPGS